MKKALIFGITGQDGSYLSEILLQNGYEVHGVVRRCSTNNTSNLNNLLDNKNLVLHYGDITDSPSTTLLINHIKPDEVYNLAAQSHVKVSFDLPEYTSNVDGLGVLRILESLRIVGLEKHVKFYQASTSELFGKVQQIPQTEETPFYPRSPYGVAKLYAYWILKNYRESYNMFACNGILFNHESPRRGDTFVTQKIVKGLNAVRKNSQNVLKLGNMDALRDWGHAKDYCNAMYLMMQHHEPDDYVISSNEQHSVREFVELSAPYFGMNIEWSGEGVNEIGIDTNTGKTVVEIDPAFFRPAEVDTLLGDSTKARTVLNWKPEYSFSGLVEEMCLFERGKA